MSPPGDLPDYHAYVISIPGPPTPEAVANPKPYEGSVVAAGTPVTLAVNTDLGRNGSDGYIVCDGPGNLLVKLSFNGSIFTTDITVKVDEILSLTGLNIHTIKIDATVSGTAYRALVV